MRTLLSIGNFDGVHRGHAALISALFEFKRSSKESFETVVLTFEPHPAEILSPGTIIPRLSPEREKIELLRSHGIDRVEVFRFDLALSKTSAKTFFEDYVVKKFNPAFIAVGHNFYFGNKREGTPGKILDWSQENGFSAKIIGPIEAGGVVISSSRIRELIQSGEVQSAARLLGRDYSIRGIVVHGDRRGRTIGFPTANILGPLKESGAWCVPKIGVYLSNVSVANQTFAALTNVGVKPTVSQDSKLIIESHLLDFDGDLYGKSLKVEFRERIRDEIKFSGIEALKAQLEADRALARTRGHG